jgi:phosphate transport system substrate-binding protein
MKRSIAFGVSLFFALGTAGYAADEIRIGGGGASFADVFDPIKAPFEKATGITVFNLHSSPGDGMSDLVKGKVDVAIGAVPLENMIAGAEKNGAKVDATKLVKTVVGSNKTVLLINPTNRVSNLTREQVKGIFTGKIVNWKEVGGDDKDIIVIWGKGTPGQNAQFKKEVLGGQEVTAIVDTTNYAKIKDTVASTPEGIGIDPHGMADASVKVIEMVPAVVSPILAITLGEPSPKVKKLYEYISGAGKGYLK